MVGVILLILMTVWFITLLLSVWQPKGMIEGTYVFIEGLAVTMPFIIVFGGIAVGAIAATIQMII
jgi:hypothetical protein